MSRPSEVPQARTPQRRNGKLRVAAILKAGEAIIVEKGYEAATMAEIAARSNTRIGSLYELHPVPKTPSLVFYGTGGASWREGSLRESSSLRLFG